MQNITIHNPDTQAATINPDTPLANITAQVKLVLDPNSYSFDGELFDEDAETIAQLIQSREVTELQHLLEDTGITVTTQPTSTPLPELNLGGMPTTRLIELLSLAADKFGQDEATWAAQPQDRLETYLAASRELKDRFERMAWYSGK